MSSGRIKIVLPKASLVVEDGWLYDSEVIVPGFMTPPVRFFQDARMLIEWKYGTKNQHYTNMYGNGGSLGRGMGMLVRGIEVHVLGVDPEIAQDVGGSEFRLLVAQETLIHRFSPPYKAETLLVDDSGSSRKVHTAFQATLPEPYELLELQCFRIEWDPVAMKTVDPFLMRVALRGDVSFQHRESPDKNWIGALNAALDYGAPTMPAGARR